MRTADFDFTLPPELIAQRPLPERDQSRLMVLDRLSGEISHHRFFDLVEHLQPGDLLVLNDSKVIPARLRGQVAGRNAEVEILLLEENRINDWWAMARPGKRARLGARLVFGAEARGVSKEPGRVQAEIVEINSEGHRRLRFTGTGNILENLEVLGKVPLPPYIERDAEEDLGEDLIRYQTVYAQACGSVAAPTAGLHFTSELLERIRQRGVDICAVTLHVGAGTFAPVKASSVSEHRLHEERFAISAQAEQAIARAQAHKARIIAVGTTAARVLESAAGQEHRAPKPWGGQVFAGAGRTRLFIHPPCSFAVVNGLITNFHLPRSTLIMLVSAFAAPGKMTGREMMLGAYAEAVRQRYRFYSYGDAMLIL